MKVRQKKKDTVCTNPSPRLEKKRIYRQERGKFTEGGKKCKRKCEKKKKEKKETKTKMGIVRGKHNKKKNKNTEKKKTKRFGGDEKG